MLLVSMAGTASEYKYECNQKSISSNWVETCAGSLSSYIGHTYGTWGGFASSASLTSLPADSLSSEFMAFAISNGAQFLYSLLYLLLIYNLSLVAMEHEWGKWEVERKRPRCTLVSGKPFDQSYFLQLPSKLLIPLMTFASAMHWLLGQAISTIETIYADTVNHSEHSVYFVSFLSIRYHLTFLHTVAELLTGCICCVSYFHINVLYDWNDGGLLVGIYLYSRGFHSSDVWVDPCMLCIHNRAHRLYTRRDTLGRLYVCRISASYKNLLTVRSGHGREVPPRWLFQ